MDREEILYYLTEPDCDEELFQKSDAVRKRFCGEYVHIRGIIEFSNHCCRNCLYCGLRRDNASLKRYRMEEDDIIRCALEVAAQGIRTIVLQSGDDFHFTQSALCRIIERVKDSTDMAVTLSVGERPSEDYRAFKLAGADRYLIKYETASGTLYGKLHPHQTLAERLRILSYLRELGFQVGAGNIVGLPGQSMEDLCSDILLLKDLDPDMASVSLFIPQHDTPLARVPKGDVSLTLRVLALTRIVTQNTHMPVTTALATADPESGLLRGLKAGADVIMPDFTPDDYRKDYTIYDNKIRITPEISKKMIRRAGRNVASDRGDSLKY